LFEDNVRLLFSGLITCAVMFATATFHRAVVSAPKVLREEAQALREELRKGTKTLAEAIPLAASSLRQPAEDAVKLMASYMR
jgi:hypothetical protein